MSRFLVVALACVLIACSRGHRDHDRGDAVAAGPGGVVPVGDFDSVGLSGGGHVVLRYGTAERVTLLRGSTQYTRIRVEDGRSLQIDACNDECPPQYDLEIEIVMPHVMAAAIEGGGNIEAASGFPAQDSLNAAVHGGGTLDLRALDAHTATAAVDGGGHIHIRTDGHLMAAVNGGGSIGHSGSGEVTSAVNGGGSVDAE